MIVWKNQFHKTTTKSTLTQADVDKIDTFIRCGHINSKHNDAIKLKRLYDKLCPHKLNNCSCIFMMYIAKEER